jgi:hypothetical protein
MASFTTRMGLIQPAGNEDRAVGPLNTNSGLLDKFMPCILVNDGVTPPTGDLYDGALVKERTSGIIWEARKNGGGTYDKVYVRYPMSFHGYWGTTAPVPGSVTTYTTYGVNTIDASLCKNSSAGNLSGAGGVFFKFPIRGSYSIRMHSKWAANSSGVRALAMNKNNTVNTGGYEILKNASSVFGTTVNLAFNQIFEKDDTITPAVWQNSGSGVSLDLSFIQISMIEPLQ